MDLSDLWGEAVSLISEHEGGVLVFRGTRVPVEALFGILRSGGTVDEFLAACPSVERWQAEAVLQVPATPPRPSNALQAHMDEVYGILARYGVSATWVHGSVARGADELGSDLDLLVDLPQGATLIDLSGLHIALEDLLGTGVDIGTIDSLQGPLRDRILAEAVPLDEWLAGARERDT